MNTAELIIIGGGQAGLATAHHALAMGLHPLILDASTGPGGSWPNYYESLKLFSPARYSALPGTPFPGDPDRYPSRDEAAAYLATYARDLDAEIRHNERVQTLATNDEGFAVETANGATFMTEKIIVATGGFGKPLSPPCPDCTNSPDKSSIAPTTFDRTTSPVTGSSWSAVGTRPFRSPSAGCNSYSQPRNPALTAVAGPADPGTRLPLVAGSLRPRPLPGRAAPDTTRNARR